MSDELCENINTLLEKCTNQPHSGDINMILKDFIIENYDELSEEGIWDEIKTQITQFANYREQSHRPKIYTPMNDNCEYFKLLYDIYKGGGKSFAINV